MQREVASNAANAGLYDGRSSYGWISIALHWATGILVVALWIIGKGIETAPPEAVDGRRALHISIAASAWLLIAFRIVWRLGRGHPHVRGQSMLVHRLASGVHYLMLAGLGLMLLSGPLVVWAGGQPIELFAGIRIPSPTGRMDALRELAWWVHENTALLLLLLLAAHVAGALKHLMFHADETFARMIFPPGHDKR